VNNFSIGNRRNLVVSLFCFLSLPLHGEVDRLVYYGKVGPGKGKHIVLVSGDEEYRSEETLPELAQMLSMNHGFKCTVLFALDQEMGIINPTVRDNIPGLETLTKADLMILFTRRRLLPDDQMKYIDDYLERGGSVLGLRTATHAFGPPDEVRNRIRAWKKNKKKNPGAKTPKPTFSGEKGIRDGSIWAPADVYGADPVSDSEILLYGKVIARDGEFKPTAFYMHEGKYWLKRRLKVSDFESLDFESRSKK